jgi:hypothetical protein
LAKGFAAAFLAGDFLAEVFFLAKGFAAAFLAGDFFALFFTTLFVAERPLVAIFATFEPLDAAFFLTAILITL